MDDIPSSAIPPIVSPVAIAPQSNRSASTASTAVAEPKPPIGGKAAVSAPPPPPVAPFGFTYSYDQSIHRMVIEARDPVSGFVVFQSPPNYAIKQFAATVGAASAPARGSSIDNAV